MKTGLEQAWRVNGAMNTLLLDGIPEKSLLDRYSPKTRTVAAQFAHLHNVRLYHLDKRGPRGAPVLDPFPRKAEPTRAALKKALRASEDAIAALFRAADENGKAKGGSGPPESFLGYFVSHESHHRGLILVSLRLSGTKMPKEITYGLWNWSRKRE